MIFKRLFLTIFFSLILSTSSLAIEQQHVVTFGQNLNFSMVRLDDAITKIGATSKASIVLRYGTFNLDSNVTITSNINFQIPPGAVLAGPYTLTIQGPFSGSTGCFGSDLTVVFASGSVDEVLPKWFSETSTSLTRTRASIQVSGIPIFLGKISADPTVTAWGLPEGGTRWFNSTDHYWKVWNGTEIVIETASAISDHGGLLGLADDDHTQYAKKASNLSDLTIASTARTNLGLGTAAVEAATKFAYRANNLDDLANAGTARTNLGLGTADSPVFATVKLSGLTDGYIPKHTSDAIGLVDSPIYTDGTNVGIGTTTPIAKLSLRTGSNDITVPVFFLGQGAADNNGYVFGVDGSLDGRMSIFPRSEGVTSVNPLITFYRLTGKLVLNGDFITKGPWVDVRAYGATTSSSDNSTAIQAAVDANPGKAILFPEVYQIGTTITITPSTANRLIGLGRTTGGLYSTANISLITFDATAGDIYYAEVSELYLAANVSGTRTSSYGIEVKGTYGLRRSSFHDLQFRGLYIGIGIWSTAVSDWLTFSNLLFDNYGSYAHSYGIYRTVNGGQAIYSNLTIFSTITGIHMDAPFGDFTITGCNFDGGNYGIYLNGSDSVYSSNFTITGNKFDNESINNVYLSHCQGWQVIGNAYSGAAIDAVYQTGSKDCVYDNWNGVPLSAPVFLGH